jgi:hypothetical protein
MTGKIKTARSSFSKQKDAAIRTLIFFVKKLDIPE